MLSEKFPELPVFIDRVNYTQLQDKGLNLDKLVESILAKSSPLSEMTKQFIIELNEEIYYSLFNVDKKLFCSSINHTCNLTEKEIRYIEDSVLVFLDEKADKEKFYEILPLDGRSFLVVIESGFLSFVTECKENLIRFLLDYLRYLYDYRLPLQDAMIVYLELKSSDVYFNLIKSRVL